MTDKGTVGASHLLVINRLPSYLSGFGGGFVFLPPDGGIMHLITSSLRDEYTSVKNVREVINFEKERTGQ
jgi:hypothetical protein